MTALKYPEPAIIEILDPILKDKVYLLRAPDQAQGPYIIVQRVDSERWKTVKKPTGMAQASIQIDTYAREYYEAKDLGALVEAKLDGFSGVVYYGEDSPRDFVRIGGASLMNDIDLLDQTDNPELFRNSMTFLVTYQQ